MMVIYDPQSPYEAEPTGRFVIVTGIGVVAMVAAIFHGTGHGAGRHALAVLTVPVVGLLISLVGSLVDGTSAGDAVLSVVAAIVGMIVGWQLVDRLRKERERSSTDTYW